MNKKVQVSVVAEARDLGYAEYEIDVEAILRSELPSLMTRLCPAPLSLDSIMKIPEFAKGAYMLFEHGKPVYAGKTDTTHGFRHRLERHYHTTSGRIGIEPGSLSFVAVRIMVFSNFDAEAILIREIRKSDQELLSWNNSGFGSNDPGHLRETQKAAEWDIVRPVNIDLKLEGWSAGTYNVRDLLLRLKRGLPYYFRYETDPHPNPTPKRTHVSHTVGHEDQRSSEVEISSGEDVTVRLLVQKVLQALPNGWTATRLPNRVILYKEPTTYPAALEALRK